MSSKYRYARLVKNEFLPEHNNTWYYPINSYLYEYYSNNKMIGFIDFKDNVFYEWAHDKNHSREDSKHASTLSSELWGMYHIGTNIVTRKKGLSILKDKIKLKIFKKVVDK